MRYWIYAVGIVGALLAVWQLSSTENTKVVYQSQTLSLGEIESVVY